MVSESRARSPFRRLRLVLLWLLVGLVAGLGGLYWLGRSGPLEPAPERAPAELSGATAVSEGFDYTQVLDNHPVFRIRGQKFRSTQEGTVELEGVGLTLYRDGSEYTVESTRADYDPGTKEAVLAGEVRLSSGHGLSVSTAELRLTQGGRRLRSEKPLKFGFPGGNGSAGGLDADLDRSSLALEGPVAASGTGDDGTPLRLEAEKATFLHQERQLSAEGKVVLAVGNSAVRAEGVTLDLAEDERTPVSVRATGGVRGELSDAEALAGSPPAFTIDADSLTLRFEPGHSTPARLEVEGTLGAAAILVANAPGGIIRVLTSRWIIGTFRAGALATVETVGSSEVKEYQDGEEAKLLRLASAKFAQADLAADRHLEALTLTGEVVLRDERLRAAADRAYLQPDAGTAQLFGEPVRVTTERGQLHAPRVIYQREGERVHAEGGVEAEFDGATLPRASGDGDGKQGPVRIRAREAFLELASNSFVFRGEVQAYQGTSVLFAEQLRAEDSQRRLAASGGVRTVWRSPDSEASQGDDPIEVASTSLTYREKEGQLRYEGEVVVTQTGRSLHADSVEVELDERQRARRMTARGKVRLLDPASGRTAEGTEALHDLLAGTVTIGGAPATVRDQAGNILKGRRFVYDLAKGTLKAAGGGK